MSNSTDYLGLPLPDDDAPGWGDDLRAGLVTIDQVIAAIASTGATEETLRRLLTAVSFSRTNTDALRVNVDGGNTQVYAIQMGSSGSIPTWYATTGSPTSMDPREQMKAQARANVQQARATRWTYA